MFIQQFTNKIMDVLGKRLQVLKLSGEDAGNI